MQKFICSMLKTGAADSQSALVANVTLRGWLCGRHCAKSFTCTYRSSSKESYK